MGTGLNTMALNKQLLAMALGLALKATQDAENKAQGDSESAPVGDGPTDPVAADGDPREHAG